MDNKWLTIKAAKKNEPTVIDIDGDIGSGWFSEGGNTTTSIKAQLKEIANLKTQKIIVNINSLGGSVNDGLGIHDALAQHAAHVTTKINGLTASAATIIAMAGDEREMSDNALFLIHQPMMGYGGNVNQLEADLEDLKTVSDRLLNVYVKRTGNGIDEIEALYNENDGNGKWITSDEAKDFGFIDSIFEPMDAAASRMISKEFFNTNKFPELPNIKTNIKMNEEKKEATGASDEFTAEAKTGIVNEIMDKMKGLFQPKAEEKKEEKAEEIDAKVETVEEEKEEVVEAKVEEVVNPLQAEVDRLTEELTAVNSKLSKADAASTKLQGKAGAEGEEPALTPEEEMLQSDVTTMDKAMNFVR